MEFRRVLFLSKFTTKGVITLTVMRRQNPAGDVMMIEVRDTGIGISKDGLSKLFQSFSQAETTTANRYGGTGLGLALTRRFCSSMGGTVEVESELRVGSSFRSEEHTSELQSLMRISYAVFCLKQKKVNPKPFSTSTQ